MIELIQQQQQILRGTTFIDLFCGIGGFHLALNSFGSECVFASDKNTEAQRVYEANFNLKPQGDITNIDEINVPAHDILCAGFPCQAFSVSGKQTGFIHPTGGLFYEIIRIAQYHQPRLILLENVANLERHNNSATILEICDQLRAINYTPSFKVLDAADFNVPQCRRRIYIVAFRNDVHNQQFEFPETIPLTRRLNNLLDNNQVDIDKVRINRKYNIRPNIKEIEQGDRNYLRIGEVGLGRQGERIYSPKGCSVTLSSSSGGLGGRTGMYLINGIVRKLTPRECARLMGFPDDFICASTSNQAYQQFGNSVVVDVLQYIIIQTIPYLIRER